MTKEMTCTKAEPIKRYCQSKQVMCELANDLGYCRITACAKSSFSRTYTINKGQITKAMIMNDHDRAEDGEAE